MAQRFLTSVESALTVKTYTIITKNIIKYYLMTKVTYIISDLHKTLKVIKTSCDVTTCHRLEVRARRRCARVKVSARPSPGVTLTLIGLRYLTIFN